MGDMVLHLWDSDPRVRSAMALALERITEQELVSNKYEIMFTPSLSASSIIADTPDGKIVGAARYRWIEHGSKVKWRPHYDLCDP